MSCLHHQTVKSQHTFAMVALVLGLKHVIHHRYPYSYLKRCFALLIINHVGEINGDSTMIRQTLPILPYSPSKCSSVPT